MSIDLTAFDREFPDAPEPSPTSEQFAALAAALAARRFDAATPPPEPRPIYRLGNAVIATQGNIQAINAQPKAGKTAFVGAMIASTMNPLDDTLSVFSSNPTGAALIHFDTEQSHYDHHAVILQALHRAGEPPPDWLRSYRLADVGIAERLALLRFELDAAHKAHGAIHSVILDGVADFCHDPNDPAEAFALIGELHRLAIHYDTTIVCVLHENPGSETGKTRGHLGSQLERKAETNLRLAKDSEGVTTVFTERARHTHIPREHGPRFKWCGEAKMHVTTTTAASTKAESKRDTLRELATEIFRDTPEPMALSWSGVHERIEKLDGLKRDGARRRFKELTEMKLIYKTGNGYRLSK